MILCTTAFIYKLCKLKTNGQTKKHKLQHIFTTFDSTQQFLTSEKCVCMFALHYKLSSQQIKEKLIPHMTSIKSA